LNAFTGRTELTTLRETLPVCSTNVFFGWAEVISTKNVSPFEGDFI
jgi:hypothetical protein